MFSGIVEEQGIIKEIGERGIAISASHVLEDLGVKDSIAVDGTCLTVTELARDEFSVDTMPETLRRTRLGTLKPGNKVNLERSLPTQGRIGGHMVQGHIEATTPVLSVREDGMALHVEAALPEALRLFIIPKGFIALNGVSLTIIDVLADRFTFALIPYTQQHTNLGEVQAGMLLNIESDVIGRYVAQHLQHYINDRTNMEISNQP
ncbi:MAG: riboflavin synthase [Ktedonobacteraceae bacterium]|nr:riboflavin synthase [Ktedonobacteraceae bacterium]